jgi:hypothetical protein
MSRDATLELLKSVRSALIADATVAAAVSNRVATDWGSSLTAPFIRLSANVAGRFEADGVGEGSEYSIGVHVFTKESGPVLSSQLAACIEAVLDEADLTVTGASLQWLTFDQTIFSQDPDDPTLRMAIVRLKAATTLA